MMNNAVIKFHVPATIILLILLMASCANLPTKVTDETNVIVPVYDNDNADDSDVDLIQNDQRELWSSDDNAPTVTPIVLPVESRGEEGALIIRKVSDEQSVIEYDDVYLVPTSEPAAYSGGMKDEMEVSRFAPVNGAVVLPNQAMHLDVTLKNTGTTTWQTSYKVIDISGNPLTVQREYNLPYAVAPNDTVMLSIYMTSPQELGNYSSAFMIQDAYGAKFGEFSYMLTVGGFSSITEIPTLTATVTPTYYSAEGITATPDSLAWMCIDPERSILQDCRSFCVEYSDREEFRYCFIDGVRYTTPVP